MRKISLRVTCCYYPSLKHSYCTHADYTLLEVPDVFCLCGLVNLSHPYQQQSFSPTYSNKSPVPRQTPLAPREDHPISVLCTCTYPNAFMEAKERLPFVINNTHNLFHFCMSGGPWPTSAHRSLTAGALSMPLDLYYGACILSGN
jgi:hypothetical protein